MYKNVSADREDEFEFEFEFDCTYLHCSKYIMNDIQSPLAAEANNNFVSFNIVP